MNLWNKLQPEEVRRSLGLSKASRVWLRKQDKRVNAVRTSLPSNEEAENYLQLLNVSYTDRTETLNSRPDPISTPALWWVLDHAFQELSNNIGTTNKPLEWPRLPESTGSVGRHLYVWVFLASVPIIRGYHKERGIPDAVSWSSLGDLGQQMAVHRRIYGTSGLHTAPWLTLPFSGSLYELGPAQFNWEEVELEMPRAPNGDQAPRRGQLALRIHIPAKNRLDIGEIKYAMKRAAEFCSEYFPDRPAQYVLSGPTWLQSEQLSAYLSRNSNIMQYQRLFIRTSADRIDRKFLEITNGEWSLGDLSMLYFIFKYPVSVSEILETRQGVPVGHKDTIIERLPQETTLQRAFTARLKSGNHWYLGYGWRALRRSQQVERSCRDVTA